ncbi:hypothetical protein QOZ80_9AG0690660 [Eleusine coracana subsp. coracana]|nr:hypothetical protein QOZ80_9AG0690660 [Eleusine coracana subsp. coracana]
MADNSSSSKRVWVRDVQKTLSAATAPVEVSQWQRNCIYRVPAFIKDLNAKAYQPRVVSLGPFHHGDKELLPMEEHKRRALRHFLRRADKPLEEFIAAIEEAAEQLESMYLDLDDRWRGVEGRERFLEMMAVDGCFVLEVIRAADPTSANNVGDYAPNDPVFSQHGVLYMVPYIRHDMLMLENQLPLLLLAKLIAVETANAPNDGAINSMMLRFLSATSNMPPAGVSLGLHPLDVYRRSIVYGPYQTLGSSHDVPETGIMWSAVKLNKAGIRFKKSITNSFHDIQFRQSHLLISMPALVVDDFTEYTLLNMVAFERLHVGAGNDVSVYLFFMNNIIRSADDVALLCSRDIIQNATGNDRVVADLFINITKNMVLEPSNPLYAILRQLNTYCQKPQNIWRATLANYYFRNPATVANSMVGVTALIATLMQTVYTVLQYFQSNTTAAPGPTA